MNNVFGTPEGVDALAKQHIADNIYPVEILVSSKNLDIVKQILKDVKLHAFRILTGTNPDLHEWLIYEVYSATLEDALTRFQYHKTIVNLNDIKRKGNEELVDSLRYRYGSLMRQR